MANNGNALIMLYMDCHLIPPAHSVASTSLIYILYSKHLLTTIGSHRVTRLNSEYQLLSSTFSQQPLSCHSESNYTQVRLMVSEKVSQLLIYKVTLGINCWLAYKVPLLLELAVLGFVINTVQRNSSGKSHCLTTDFMIILCDDTLDH